MSKVHIEEFLYRGRPEDSEQAPAWHVILGETGKDTFGNAYCNTHIFNMAQAEAAGYPLPKLISTINSDLLKAHEELHQKHEQLRSQVEDGVNLQIDELKIVKEENERLKLELNSIRALPVRVAPKTLWQSVKDFFANQAV